jgi:hypothetical protein
MYTWLKTLGGETYRAEPLVHEPSMSEGELVIENLKRYKSSGIYKSKQNRLNKEVGQFILRSISLLVLFGIRRNCLNLGKSRSLYLFIRKMIKYSAVIVEAYHVCQLPTKFYLTSFCQS